MKRIGVTLSERFIKRRFWLAWRSGIDAAVVPHSGGVAFLGDSLTHMARWDLMFPGVRTRNFGIGGERAEHLLERLEPVIALRPERLFLLIGSNDLNAGCRVDEIAAEVGRILDRLAVALPDCRLHLQGVLPRARKFAGRIGALNQAYARIAAERGLAFIDLFPLFDSGSGELRQALTYDGLHLTGSGYAVWREALLPWVGGIPGVVDLPRGDA